jgi:hypothetical protein
LSYSHTMHDTLIASAVALTPTGAKGTWPVTGLAKTIRRLSAVVTTATTAADPCILSFDLRVTAGSDTGRVTAGVGTLTLPGGTVAGTVVYKNVNVTVRPGQEVVLTATDATAAGVATVGMTVEEAWETPANVAAMVASA